MRWLLIIGLVAVSGGIVFQQRRGLRNNNPLNIRQTDDQWQGQAGVDSDGFVIFKAPEYGYRAAARILKSYARRGIVTVDGIVSTWAPDSENDTESYIDHVSNVLKLGRFDPVPESRWSDLLAVMTVHENGKNPYSLDEIKNGVALA